MTQHRKIEATLFFLLVMAVAVALFGLARLCFGAYGEIQDDGDIIGCWHLNDNDATETDSCGANDMSMSGETYSNNGFFEGGYNYTTDASSTSYQPDGSDVSITLWIYINDLDSRSYGYSIFAGCNDGSNHRLYFGGYYAGAVQGFPINRIALAWGASYQTTASFSWQTSVWYHIVFTASGSDATLYINGEEEDSFSGAGFSGTSSDSVGIGGYGSYQVPGAIIDEVVIYSRTLTVTEVKQIYAMQKGGYGIQ